ncbi:MAG: PCI domain-containing protein [Nitrososphaeria archaeon]
MDILNKDIAEEKIHALIDAENLEVIYYEPEELDELSKLLSTKCIPIPEIASRFQLTNNQTKLIIDSLTRRGKISGITIDDIFVPNNAVKKLVINTIEKLGKIDFHEIAKEQSLPEDKVKEIIENCNKAILKALIPFSRVKISDLCQELNLPIKVTTILLRDLISNGKLDASIDSVEGIILIEKMVKTTTKYYSNKKDEEHKKPKSSLLWFLVPLFLGLLGGILAYLAVKDENREMASDLLILGILTTIIGIIIFMATYNWLLSMIS